MPLAGSLHNREPPPLSPVVDAEFPGSHYTLQTANPRIPEPHLTFCDVAPLTGRSQIPPALIFYAFLVASRSYSSLQT